MIKNTYCGAFQVFFLIYEDCVGEDNNLYSGELQWISLFFVVKCSFTQLLYLGEKNK